MGSNYSQPEPPPDRPRLVPPQPVHVHRHRRSGSLGTSGLSRFSSACPTPPVLQGRDWDDDCRHLRRMLGATHKVCKNKPRQIDALAQSLGKASGRDGPDGGLGMYIQNFDNSVTTLYRLLSLNSHVLHSSMPPLKVKEFTETLSKLAVDLERWQIEFTSQIFPEMGKHPSGGKKTLSKLRQEGKALGKRCFRAAGKLDALSCMDDGHGVPSMLSNLARARSPSIASLRASTRTPSPMGAASIGRMRTPSPPMPPIIAPAPQRAGRGVAMVGVV